MGEKKGRRRRPRQEALLPRKADHPVAIGCRAEVASAVATVVGLSGVVRVRVALDDERLARAPHRRDQLPWRPQTRPQRDSRWLPGGPPYVGAVLPDVADDDVPSSHPSTDAAIPATTVSALMSCIQWRSAARRRI